MTTSDPAPRVLHVLCQRPLLTGSGVTLDALVRHASGRGWAQAVAVGVPTSDPSPSVGGLSPDHIHPLLFERPPVDFPVPGMSDVMPYPSTRFSDLEGARLDQYRSAWSTHLARLIERFEPSVIHAHHFWLLSAWLKDITDVPVVTHVHATGLRQLSLAAHLADEVREKIGRNDVFCVLNDALAQSVRNELADASIEVVGAGFREDLFRPGRPEAGRVLYAGKLSRAKGVLELLEAFAPLAERAQLYIAGSGAGEEAEAIEARANAEPGVHLLGRLSQADLAEHMQKAQVFVLPSYYEGVPLVLVEALASGCRLVSSDLPGLQDLSPHLGDALTRVPLPELDEAWAPKPGGLGDFVAALTNVIASALDRPPPSGFDLQPFTWAGVFARVEPVWTRVAKRRDF